LGMEARQCLEFTGVELAAPMEKAAIGPVEKIVAGRSYGEDVTVCWRWLWWAGGTEGGRRTAALGCDGDAGRRTP
jgi:hypothetical protein